MHGTMNIKFVCVVYATRTFKTHVLRATIIAAKLFTFMIKNNYVQVRIAQ